MISVGCLHKLGRGGACSHIWELKDSPSPSTRTKPRCHLPHGGRLYYRLPLWGRDALRKYAGGISLAKAGSRLCLRPGPKAGAARRLRGVSRRRQRCCLTIKNAIPSTDASIVVGIAFFACPTLRLGGGGMEYAQKRRNRRPRLS